MINLTEIQEGKTYRFTYTAQADLLVRGNPLRDSDVTVRKSIRGEAVSEARLNELNRQLDPSYTPSTKPNDNQPMPGFPCIVRSNATGELKVRLINVETLQTRYQVDGKPATAEQLAIIAQFKSEHKRNPLRVRVSMPYLNHLNVNQDVPDSILDAD